VVAPAVAVATAVFPALATDEAAETQTKRGEESQKHNPLAQPSTMNFLAAAEPEAAGHWAT
jgi:hypothetical protein